MKKIVYRYDGSLEGILCCVYEIYTQKEFPKKILLAESPPTPYPEKQIKTNPKYAARVWRSLPGKLGRCGARMVQDGYWTCLPDKELLLCRFIAKGYRYGTEISEMLGDATVQELQRGIRCLYSEVRLFCGFTRFSVQDRMMIGSITPKNRVLPLLKEHFCSRYGEEYFMLCDKTHKEVLLHQPGRGEIISAEEFSFDSEEEDKQNFKRLWKKFYDAITIQQGKDENTKI